MPSYLQRRFAKKHSHKYVVDTVTNDAVCLHCGNVRGSPRAKPGKYKAIRSVYNGYPYDSKLEAQYAMQLDWRLKAGDIKAWARQFPIEIRNPKTGESSDGTKWTFVSTRTTAHSLWWRQRDLRRGIGRWFEVSLKCFGFRSTRLSV